MSIRPTDAYTANGWYFEAPGLVSPHFQKLEGIGKKSGEISIVDGSTNIKHKFSSQLKEFKDITLTRVPDGSVDDYTLRALVDECMDNGFRFDGNLVKLHNGKEVFRILFLGMRIKEYDHPSYDTASEERLELKYLCSVSEWVEI